MVKMLEGTYSIKALKDVKKGEFFRTTNNENGIVYVKGDYDRSDKKYSCYAWKDYNKEIFVKGNKNVFVDFTY